MSLDSLVASALRELVRPRSLPSWVPTSGSDLVEVPERPAVLARRLLGLEPGARLPIRGSEERRAYDRLVRRFYRRGGKAPSVSARVLRDAGLASRRALVIASGTRNRIALRLDISSPGPGGADHRSRVLPMGGPGVFLAGDEVEALLERLDGGQSVGAEWLEAFGAAYGFELDADDIDSVEFVHIWLPDEPEPS